MSSKTNWLQSTSWQIEFTQNLRGKKRRDGEGDWDLFERATHFRLRALKKVLAPVLALFGSHVRKPLTLDWLHDNVDKLWNTRSMLTDDLSRLLFDSSLVLRISNHRQFYFPRFDFEDLIEVRDIQPFDI